MFIVCFLTDDLLELIAIETNRYAHQVINNTTLARTSRLHKWNDDYNVDGFKCQTNTTMLLVYICLV